MNISELSVKRPTLVVVIFAVLCFLGFMGMRGLNYELLPKWTAPIFTVVTVYPGASPVEVESSVTKKVEEAVASLSNVDVVRSISQEGVSLVIVSLKVDADVDPVVNEAVRKIQSIKGELPVYAKEPSVTQISMDDMPVLTVGVMANMPANELFDELEYRIKPELARIEGVGEITFIGETPREVQVNVNHQKLDAYGLSILQVVEAIHGSNFDYPAGKIKGSNGQTLLRMSGKFSTVPDIANQTVALLPDGSLVRVADVADIQSALKEPSTIYRVNGEQSVGLEIRKNQDANTVEVSKALKSTLNQLEQKYANVGLRFSIPQDGSIIIEEAAQGVTKDLIYAIVLVTLIMIFFLHSGRNALIVMISVPLSLISTFVGIYMFGYTLNLMTLLALSLIIGTLVDDAIVVLENVYRHLEMGKNRWQATLDGVKEVNLTVISTSLVLIVVFFPVAISKSIISPMIGPFAMVVVIAVVVSTFAALTVIPLLTSRFSKLQVLTKTNIWNTIVLNFEKGIDAFAGGIEALLIWSLKHKFITLVTALVLFLSSFMLVGGGFVGTEFVSMGDVGEGIITVEYPKSYTLKQNNIATRSIEEYISAKPEVVGVYTSVGKSTEMLAVQSGSEKTEISVKLIDKQQRSISASRFFKKLENELNSQFAGVKVRTAIVSLVGGADENPIQIVFQGSNKDTLMLFAQHMLAQIKRIPGTNNAKLTIEQGSPELVIRFDKEKMARLGLTPQMVGATIQTSFSGNADSKFQQGDYEYDINIKLDAFNRKSVDDVRALAILNNMGQTVKLEQFATITEESGASRLERYGRISSVSLEAQAIGRAVGDVGADIQQLLSTTKRPNGITYVLEGDLKYQGDAFGSLGIAILIAIVLVYLVMVALYQSYLHPFVVLFSIPLSIIGALLALALAQETISIFTMLGMIMLIGLVTKNAILVVDFINALRSEGSDMLRAIVTAVRLRIRPILMTAISTVVGMLPIALSQSPGSEWKNGLGWALIGGMTSSMLLSLIIVPVVYYVAEKAKENILKRLKMSNK